MAKYLISFPRAAMVVPDGEWEAVGRDAHAVMDGAKADGIYVFGGGIDNDVPPGRLVRPSAPLMAMSTGSMPTCTAFTATRVGLTRTCMAFGATCSGFRRTCTAFIGT